MARAAVRRAGQSLPPPMVLGPSVLVGIALLLPLAYLAVRTLSAGPDVWDLLLRARTMAIVMRSLLLVVSVSVTTVALALPLAWLTTRTDLPGRRIWAVVSVLPLVIPTYVGGFLIVVALGPKGMLQGFLSPLGVERLPAIYGFPGALTTLALLSYPYVLLTVRAALLRLDPALEEASRSLGKGPWSTFRHAILPQLRPAIAAGALLSGLYTLSDFGAVSLLRYETFTWAIFTQYQSAFDRSMAAALSLVLVGVAAALVAAESRTRNSWRYHRSTAGTARPPSTIPLGKWKWAAVVFCVVVMTLSLALPVGILAYWAVRGAMSGEALAFVWSDALNSIYVSALAAGMTVAAALPLSVLVVRHPGKIGSLLERTGYVGFALPGIAVAIALVFFGANYAPGLYQTVGLLVFAYAVLFFPTAIGAARASLLQISPQVEEAGRSLGKAPWRVFLTITLPLMRAGILAGAGLVFLLSMKELPATLILSPAGFNTLATSIWSAASEAFFARAAVPALLLIVASSFSVALILWREKRLES